MSQSQSNITDTQRPNDNVDAGPTSTNTKTDSNATPTSRSNTSDANGSADKTTSPPGGDSSYPEQLHAGKIGYGPNYRTSPSLGDKITGLKETVKGKITHNQQHIEHGRAVYTGEQKKKDLFGEDDKSPFKTADEDDKPKEQDGDKAGDQSKERPTKSNEQQSGIRSKESFHEDAHAKPSGVAYAEGQGAKEEAATVAPEGVDDAETQRRGNAVDHMKDIDES